jgi:hypothetical protein
MTDEALAERMGSDATTAEAAAMRRVLAANALANVDIDDIDEDLWVEMVGIAWAEAHTVKIVVAADPWGQGNAWRHEGNGHDVDPDSSGALDDEALFAALAAFAGNDQVSVDTSCAGQDGEVCTITVVGDELRIAVLQAISA